MQRADLGYKPSECRQECFYLCNNACHVCSSSCRAQSLNCLLCGKERLFALTTANIKADHNSCHFKSNLSSWRRAVLTIKAACCTMPYNVGVSIVLAVFAAICVVFSAAVAVSAMSVVYAAEQELNVYASSTITAPIVSYSSRPSALGEVYPNDNVEALSDNKRDVYANVPNETFVNYQSEVGAYEHKDAYFREEDADNFESLVARNSVMNEANSIGSSGPDNLEELGVSERCSTDSTLSTAEAHNTSRTEVDGSALQKTNDTLISPLQDQTWMNDGSSLISDEQGLMNEGLTLMNNKPLADPVLAESYQKSELNVVSSKEVSKNREHDVVNLDAASQEADNSVLFIQATSESLSSKSGIDPLSSQSGLESLSNQSKVEQSISVQSVQNESGQPLDEQSLALGFGNSMINPIHKLFPSSIEHNNLESSWKTVENRSGQQKPNLSNVVYKEPLVMNVSGHSLVMGDGTELSFGEDFSYIKRIINNEPLHLSKDTCYYFKTYADAQIAPDQALINHLSKVHNVVFDNFESHIHALIDNISHTSSTDSDIASNASSLGNALNSSNASTSIILPLNHSRYLDPSIDGSNARYICSVLQAAELEHTLSQEKHNCSQGGYFVKNGKNAEKCRELQSKRDLTSIYQRQAELERILLLKGDNKSVALSKAQAISDYEHHDSEEAALIATGKTPLKDYMSKDDFKAHDYSFRALESYILDQSYYNEHSPKAESTSDDMLYSYFDSPNKVQPRILKNEVIIGFSAVQFANSWYKDIVRGMSLACKDLDIKCVVVDAEGSESKQVQDIEQMLKENYNAIISVPMNNELIAHLYKEAQTKGIVTASLVNTIPYSDLEYELLEYDYGYSIGEQAAQWASKHLNCNATVVVLSQDNIESSVIRGDGIIDALYNKCPNLNIVTRALSSTPQQGQTITANLLKYYPDLNMVVASSDAAGIGAYQAMVQANAIGSERAVFSGDATLDALALLKEKDNIFRGTVKLSPIRTGYESIKRMHALMHEDKHLSPLREFMPFVALSKEEYITTLSLSKD